MVIKRTQLSGDARARLDVQLDLHILARWIAGLKPSSDDHAAVLFIRVQQLNAVAGNLQKQFAGNAGNEPINKVQQASARQLHLLTID